MKKNVKSNIFLEVQNYYFVFESRLILFFKWSYLQRCLDVAQRCENRRWKRQLVLALSNVVQFNVEIFVVSFNVDLTLYDIATSYEPNNNVGFLTLVKFLSVFCVNTLIINYYFNSGSQLSNLQDYLLIIILKYNFPLYTFYQLL